MRPSSASAPQQTTLSDIFPDLEVTCEQAWNSSRPLYLNTGINIPLGGFLIMLARSIHGCETFSGTFKWVHLAHRGLCCHRIISFVSLWTQELKFSKTRWTNFRTKKAVLRWCISGVDVARMRSDVLFKVRPRVDYQITWSNNSSVKQTHSISLAAAAAAVHFMVFPASYYISV